MATGDMGTMRSLFPFPLITTYSSSRNILFICGGAFDGIEKIIEKRKDNEK